MQIRNNLEPTVYAALWQGRDNEVQWFAAWTSRGECVTDISGSQGACVADTSDGESGSGLTSEFAPIFGFPKSKNQFLMCGNCGLTQNAGISLCSFTENQEADEQTFCQPYLCFKEGSWQQFEVSKDETKGYALLDGESFTYVFEVAL